MALTRFPPCTGSGIRCVLAALVFLPAPCPTLLAREASPALARHPDNPRYFVFRGEPTVLVTSAEHYGAVLNLDFDHVKYLDTLHGDGLNLTRLFSGAYVEPSGAFNITRNTLAPARGRFLCPWARSETPGYANGGNKFDLDRWSDDYFERLRDFVHKASERGIVVEMVLFCPFYRDGQWNLSPQNARNNVNGIGKVRREEVYTLDRHGGLLAVHENMTRKVVRELSEFDNVYFEICNEPYFGGVTMAWQHRIADVIVETEDALGTRHLISQNIANGKARIVDPHPAVDIFNFHYASPPDAVGLNYHLDRVIGDNETGFRGQGNTHYRMEGWEFLLAGGGLYNNLDYSFAVGHEDGTFEYPAEQPGGGNPTLRRQLRILGDFIHSLDFLRMKPVDSSVLGSLPAGVRSHVLAEPGRQIAVYIFGGHEVELKLEMPRGEYRVEWVDTLTGKVEQPASLRPVGGKLTLRSPRYQEDIALRVVRADKP